MKHWFVIAALSLSVPVALPDAIADRVAKPKATAASVTAKRDKLVKARDELRALIAKPPAEKLSAEHKKAYDDFVKAAKDTAAGADALATKLTEGLKVKTPDFDALSEMGEMESLRLQMAMDRQSKVLSTLSNVLKKISDTANQITQNMK
jgi:hypothetical protein